MFWLLFPIFRRDVHELFNRTRTDSKILARYEIVQENINLLQTLIGKKSIFAHQIGLEE